MTTSSPVGAPLPGTARYAKVVTISEVAPRHFQLKLQQPAVAHHAKPGQFVHVLCREGAQLDPFLRRAFSVMSVDGDTYDILFRVEGKGTAWLSHLSPGEELDILGPLGNGFSTELDFQFQPILVGGGVGVPPMVSLANHFSGGAQITQAFIGARGQADLIGLAELGAAGAEVAVATEDGSQGFHGRITDPLIKYLDSYPADSSVKPVVYSCGPYPMLRAVALICLSRKVACQVSLEENMPCGVGLCNGCVIATSAEKCEGNDFDRYQRICVTGPAIWAEDIDWGQN